jgi:hypothetical protein
LAVGNRGGGGGRRRWRVEIVKFMDGWEGTRRNSVGRSWGKAVLFSIPLRFTFLLQFFI